MMKINPPRSEHKGICRAKTAKDRKGRDALPRVRNG